MGSGTDGGMDNGMDDEAGGRWHDEAHGGADKLDVRRRRDVSAEYFGGLVAGHGSPRFFSAED